MTISYIMSRCLVMFLRGGKVNVVDIYMRKVIGEQVVTLQMAQQLKTKNIDVVPVQLFCRQCKAKFLLEADSLY